MIGMGAPLTQVGLDVAPGAQLPELALRFQNVVVGELALRHGGSDGLVFEINVGGSVRIGAGDHGGDGDGDLPAAHVGESHSIGAAALPGHPLFGPADVSDRPGQIAVPVDRVQR